MSSEIHVALTRYLEKSSTALIGATMIFDYAVSTEKMMSWQCVGDDNDAWNSGPYLSSGANETQIDRSHPYVICTSIETRAAIQHCLDETPQQGTNGGYKLPLPLPPSKPDSWSAEPLIAKMAIIEQFEFYREFSRDVNAPINERTTKLWVGRLDEYLINRLKFRTDRRNALTHDIQPDPPTMREAVEFALTMRVIAKEVVSILARESGE